MARNIEIKARIPDIIVMAAKVAAVATEGPIEIPQDDTFFPCAAGRLKLRQFSTDRGELIFYRRADEGGPKESHYLLSPTTSPDSLRQSLAAAYGIAGRVRKQRMLYLIGRTRVHLDRVEGLGEFIELEVVLDNDEPADDGIREAHALMEVLQIQPTQLVNVAYVDLLARANDSTQT